MAVEGPEAVYTDSKKRELIPISGFLANLGHVGGTHVVPRGHLDLPTPFVWRMLRNACDFD